MHVTCAPGTYSSDEVKFLKSHPVFKFLCHRCVDPKSEAMSLNKDNLEKLQSELEKMKKAQASTVTELLQTQEEMLHFKRQADQLRTSAQNSSKDEVASLRLQNENLKKQIEDMPMPINVSAKVKRRRNEADNNSVVIPDSDERATTVSTRIC